MDTLQTAILDQLKRTEAQIKKIEKYISDAPDGKLYCSIRGKYREYRIGIINDNNYIRKSISNKDPRIEILFKKRFYLLLSERLHRNARLLKRFLSLYRSNINEQIYTELKPWEQTLFEKYFTTNAEFIQKWKDEPYIQNPFKPEERDIKTLSGAYVRSKSEREIANALYRNKIPFRTDCKFEYNGGVMYTDFVILHPRTLEVYYWEHSGILDDPKYNKNNNERIANYASQGIMIGDKLIMTGETSDHVLDSNVVEEIIARYFT